jgi:phasin family protein
MQQKNPAENFFTEVQSSLKQLMSTVPTAHPFDFKSIMETQRKNIQAITEANQRAFQGWRSLAQRQTEMLSQFVQDNSGLARETFTEGTPEAKFAKQAELVRTSYEKTVENAQELVEIASKCTKDASEVINSRVVATFNEIKSKSKTSA